jgi:GNAT superfamily N-acetyltransferase
MADADWTRWLVAEHESRSRALDFSVDSLGEDESPPITHRIDVVASEAGSFEEEDAPAGVEPGSRLARLLVNEFPLHLNREEWMWAFDRCAEGPSEELGAALDEMIATGAHDVERGRSGAVLHLQNLEVDPRFRRHGIGTRLVRYAMGLLSRSNYDLALSEFRVIQPPYPPLFPDKGEFPAVQWESRPVLRSFLTKAAPRSRRISSVRRNGAPAPPGAGVVPAAWGFDGGAAGPVLSP